MQTKWPRTTCAANREIEGSAEQRRWLVPPHCQRLSSLLGEMGYGGDHDAMGSEVIPSPRPMSGGSGEIIDVDGDSSKKPDTVDPSSAIIRTVGRRRLHKQR